MYSEDDERTVMIIESVQTHNKKILVNGFAADWILTKRVSNVKVEKEAAETAIKNLVDAIEPFQNFSFGEVKGFTDVYNAQKQGGDIYTYCKTICKATDIGFRTIKNGKQLSFELYKPEANPNLRFSEVFGNMGEENYTVSDINTANVAMVVGDNDSVVWVGNTEAKGLERKEIYVTAKGSTADEMETIGAEALVEHVRVEEIKFNLQDNDVKLGDIVSVRLDSQKISLTVRVTSKEIKNQKNITKKTIGVGTPISIKRRA